MSGSMEAHPQDPTDAIVAAYRELESRKAVNLELLRHTMPQGYERFRDYEPARLKLSWDPAVGVTVTGVKTGLPLYPGDPREYARRQVEGFCAEPSVRLTGFIETGSVDIDQTVHLRRANTMVAALNERPRDPVEGFSGFVNTLFVFGLGMGHHIEELMARADIHHLCIVEPEEDLFYAALHTLDLEPLLRHFARPGYSLEFIVGRSAQEAVQQVVSWIDEIGGHNLVQPFVFKHRGGEIMAQTALQLIHVVLPHYVSFLGYFEDEQTSFAHSVANVEAGVPVLASPDGGRGGEDGDGLRPPMPPVFVVANGPSLDDGVAFIREHRNRAVVISCGTALGSLSRAGILPDIHVEMERIKPVVEWIDAATTPEQRQEIRLVALNTGHPQVFDLFPKAAMALRGFDLGAGWLESRRAPGVELLKINEPGPTVGNCGLGVAAALGFTDITAFGLDLGYPAGDQHHSRLSVYYEVGEEDLEEMGLPPVDDPNNIVMDGNFGGEVRTTPIYATAAQRVGFLASQNPGITIRNTARGLRIPGTVPTRLAEIELGDGFDTRAFADRLLDAHTRSRAVAPATPADLDAVRESVAEVVAQVSRMLSLDVDDREGAMLQLLFVHMQLHRNRSDDRYREAIALLKGSVAHFSLLLAQALHVRRDEGEALALFRYGREILKELLDDAAGRVSGDGLLALDSKVHELARKVVAA